MNEKELMQLKCEELREMLRFKGLNGNGRKNTLVKRLLESEPTSEQPKKKQRTEVAR